MNTNDVPGLCLALIIQCQGKQASSLLSRGPQSVVKLNAPGQQKLFLFLWLFPRVSHPAAHDYRIINQEKAKGRASRPGTHINKF